jgi:hypothetical protein
LGRDPRDPHHHRNLASAVGTAVAGALLVGILSANVTGNLTHNVELPPRLVAQVDLDNINFINNDRHKEMLAGTDATPGQVDAAVALNEQVRLRALRLGLLVLAALGLVAVVPANRLPHYRPGEIPETGGAMSAEGD